METKMLFMRCMRVVVLVLFLFSLPLCAFAEYENADPAYVQRMDDLYKRMSKYSSGKLLDMGMDMFRNRQEYDSAVVCLAVVKNRYRKGMDEEHAKMCIVATSASGYLALYRFSDYARAYDCLVKALKMCEETGIYDDSPAIYLNLGNLFSMCSRNLNSKALRNTAVGYYNRGLDEAKRLNDWDKYIKNYIYLTNVCYMEKDMDALRDINHDFMRVGIPSSERNHDAAQCRYLAVEALLNNNHDQAIDDLEKEMKFMKGSLVPERYHVLTLGLIATIYERTEQKERTISTWHEALAIAERFHMIDVTTSISKHVAELYREMNDNDRYELFYNRYAHARDSLFSFYGLEKISEQHFLAQVNEAEIIKNKERNSRWMYIFLMCVALAFALLAIVIAIVLRSKNKYLDERNRLLYEKFHEKVMVEEVGAEAVKEGVKYKNSTLSQEEKQKLVETVKETMRISENIYKTSFTVEQLAQIVGSTPRNVSQVINECLGMNFNSLLAEQRVKEACRRFDEDSAFGKLTIEAVAQSVGFKSRNSLITAFKKTTGLTPSEYQKMSKE